jgi:predicted MFS family arabinose efflux permease
MSNAIRSGASDVATGLAPPESLRGEVTTGYRYYVLAIVWLVMLIRFVDLQIVAVLLESIREEFHISDTQLGLLSGTAFGLFYATLGLPVAWLADRYNRRNIIAACLALWSGMTMLCGFASSFAQLFLARLGVGVGEAGGQPPSYSLISDYFPASRRSTVFAILSSAVPAGVFVGYLIGGYINVAFGWRATFAVIGIAGVLVAVLFRFTVREPVRGRLDGRAEAGEMPSAMETFRALWSRKTYRHIVAGSSVAVLASTGVGMWIAAFFIRVHQLPPLQVTTWLAFIYGGIGFVGALAGGTIADWLTRHSSDARWQLWLPAIAMVAVLPIAVFVLSWPVATVALLAVGGSTFFNHAWMGPVYGMVQNLTGPRQRATAAAVNMLVINLIALGLGPLLVGAASDAFREQFANDSLRYSMIAVAVVCYSWASLHFMFAARTLREDLQEGTRTA